jgi:hypothetical protein
MVKNVLIGKNRDGQTAEADFAARFVGSRFILNEARGVMVNRAFRNCTHDSNSCARPE